MNIKVFLFVFITSVVTTITQQEKGRILVDKKKFEAHKTFKQSLFTERQTYSTDEPTVTRTVLPNDSNNYGYISYDPLSHDLLFLTFDGLGKFLDHSILYLFRNLGQNHSKLELTYDGAKLVPDDIMAKNSLLIVNDRKLKVVAISSDGGQSFKYHKFINYVDKIQASPSHHSAVLALDSNDDLYITMNKGETWELTARDVEAFVWSQSENYFYFLKDSVISSNSREVIKAPLNNPHQHQIMVSDCDSLKSNDEVIYTTTKNENRLELWISYKDKPFTKAIFPFYLKPTKYFVHEATSHEIFVVVVNATKDIHLYSAPIRDNFKFTKILSNVGFHTNYNEYDCVGIEFFDELPGVIVAHISDKYYSEKNRKTAISFNDGSKWSHVHFQAINSMEKCDWPDCFLSLELHCSSFESSGITSVKKAPNIMIANGQIFRNGNASLTGMFISTDAGLSWYSGLQNSHEYTILDHGGIIVSLLKTKNVIYYSYDHGLTWKYTIVDNDDFFGLYMNHDSNGVSTSAIAIGFDGSTKLWEFLRINFSSSLKTPCKKDDYDLFTPGAEERSQCFRGKKNSFYRRKHDAKCLSIIEKLPEKKITSCPCLAEDFGCNFGYLIAYGLCEKDPDFKDEGNNTLCKAGDIALIPSPKSKLMGDVCIDTGAYADEEANICGYTYDKDIVTTRDRENSYFTDINVEPSLIKLPLKTRNIISADVDMIGRCYYFSYQNILNRICWGTKEHIYTMLKQTVLRDVTALKLQYDSFGSNLYIMTQGNIIMQNVKSRKLKTLVTENNIVFFTLFKYASYLLYITSEKSNTKTVFKAKLCLMDGNQIREFETSITPISAAYITANQTLIIYSAKEMLVFSASTNTTTSFPISTKIVNSYKNDSLNIYVEPNRVHVNRNYIDSDRKLIEASINLNDNAERNGCQFSHCTHLCIPLAGGKYVCACPDGMKMGDKDNCTCFESNPDCTSCPSQDFSCESGECIDILYRCDDVRHCEDGSDEKNCETICDHDEFLCTDQITCVNIVKRCDGVNDCPDKFDEKDCRYIYCKQTEFMCDNAQCISRDKYCDGVADCDDESDEDDCEPHECIGNEFKCKSGKCIASAQVCNGVFDCPDWEDEVNCKGEEDYRNSSCAIFCDSRCLPAEKVCNHFTDCSNGFDEKRCNHSIFCADGYLSCKEDYFCYSKKEQCNQFLDCPDGSDEFNCKPFDYCNHINFFKCDSGTRCLDVNDYCNGEKDCDDGLDEPEDCHTSPTILNLDVQNIDSTSVKLKWSGNRLDHSINYQIIIFEWENPDNQRRFNSTQSDGFIIRDLTLCAKYYATVYIDSSDKARSIHLFTHNIQRTPPSDIQYDGTKKLLSWSYIEEKCTPSVFYVSCTDTYNVKHNNFTEFLNISITNRLKNCVVATCPTNVFNLSCSEFGTLHFPGYGLSGSAIIGVISSILIIGVLILGIILYRKGYLSWLQRRYRNFLSLKPFTFNVSSNEISKKTGKNLLDEDDDAFLAN